MTTARDGSVLQFFCNNLSVQDASTATVLQEQASPAEETDHSSCPRQFHDSETEDKTSDGDSAQQERLFGHESVSKVCQGPASGCVVEEICLYWSPTIYHNAMDTNFNNDDGRHTDLVI